jgi:hypothetical protein
LPNFSFFRRSWSWPGPEVTQEERDYIELRDSELEDYLRPGPWILFSTLGYTSPWTDFSTTDRPMRIRLEGADIVRVEGLMKTTANVSAPGTIVTLPPEFRPIRTQDSPLFTTSFFSPSAPQAAFFEVQPTGSFGGAFGGSVLPATYSYIYCSWQYTLG